MSAGEALRTRAGELVPVFETGALPCASRGILRWGNLEVFFT